MRNYSRRGFLRFLGAAATATAYASTGCGQGTPTPLPVPTQTPRQTPRPAAEPYRAPTATPVPPTATRPAFYRIENNERRPSYMQRVPNLFRDVANVDTEGNVVQTTRMHIYDMLKGNMGRTADPTGDKVLDIVLNYHEPNGRQAFEIIDGARGESVFKEYIDGNTRFRVNTSSGLPLSRETVERVPGTENTCRTRRTHYEFRDGQFAPKGLEELEAIDFGSGTLRPPPGTKLGRNPEEAGVFYTVESVGWCDDKSQ